MGWSGIWQPLERLPFCVVAGRRWETVQPLNPFAMQRRWGALRRLIALLMALGVLLASSLPAVGAAGESPWRPKMNSPVDFYQIQVDKDTPAQDKVADIYAEVHAKYPEAANNAEHAAIAR